MKCSIFITIVSWIFCSQLMAQVQVGSPAPELGLEHTAQVPVAQSADLESLKGKAIVLEFWATWCGPCISSFPHFNHLAHQYEGKDIVFISVTHETPDVANIVLKKRPLKTWLGFDTDDALRKAYQFKSLPQSVLIDPQGNVAAFTRPDQLSTAVIDALLAGQPLPTPMAKITVDPGTDPKSKKPGGNVLRKTAYPHAPRSYNGSRDGTKLSLINVDADFIFRSLLQAPKTRVIGREFLEGQRFDIITNVNDRNKIPELANRLLGQVDLTVRREKRTLNTLVLRAGRQAGNNADQPGQKKARRMDLKRLATMLEIYENTPILDQSGLSHVYLTGLPPKGYVADLRERLVEQEQLLFSEEERELDVVVLEELGKH